MKACVSNILLWGDDILFSMPKLSKIHDVWRAKHRISLSCGDSHLLIKSLPDASVDLVVTSPPYCIGKVYEDKTKPEEFLVDHKIILPEIVRVLKPGGSICWQVGYHVRNGVITPLDYVVYSILSAFPEILLRNRIVWTFGHGLHETSRFSGRHETLLWFTKGPDYTFNLDDVRVMQKYPGKKGYKGTKKGELSGNPLGKNPSDVWDVPNVKANHIEKTDHPCQFPVAIAERLIKALTKEGDLVFDPYVGSGSSGVAAVVQKRKFYGVELDSAYFDIATERIKSALDGRADALTKRLIW